MEPRALPRLSEEFRRLAGLCAGETVSLRVLLGNMTPRDQAVLTLVLSAAFLHPVPMPGISTLFGMVIAVCGWRISLGKGPWIPKRWLERELPARFLGKVFEFFAGAFNPVERLVRPRGRWLAAHPGMRRANGLALALMGILIVVPLPPPTNFPPAIGGVLLSAGVLEDDLLVIGLGWVGVALNVLIFGAIAIYGWEGVQAVWKRLF